MDFLKTTFADFEELFEEGDLKEIPVDLDTFLNDPYYLGKAKIKQISEVQRKIIESISQIYKLPTLIEIHGEEEGTRIWEEDTYHEIVAMCGKGGGKDFSSRLGFIYTIYKLHCLRDPITYYDKAHGTYIDLLNIAINADQANNVFFSPLKNIISMSPYFQEKGFEPRKSTLEFYECPIRLHSGNSEAEAWEGLDLMLVVLDEIAAFKTDSNLKNNAGGAQRLSASSIYDMSKNSVVSRFGDIGKVVLLSFPRFSGDFICQRYDESASEGGVLRIKAPTWVMNPFVTRESLEPQFRRSPVQAEMRFGCNPPEMIDAFFRDPAAVRQCFRGEWEVIDAGTPEEKRVLREIPELFPLNPDGTFKDWFEAKDDYPRFIHVDLGLKRDRAALCMVHSPGTRKVEIEYEVYENLPVIKMDLIHYWEAKEGQEIDFSQVREMIKLLARKFPVAKVTFDRWNSNDMVQMLNRRGIYATHHSVKKNDYDTLSTAFYDGRFSGYFVEELVEKELLKLQILNNGKVDHPEGFHDDLAQALASAVWNCCEHADLDAEIELDILGTADDWEALEYAEAVDEERRRKDRRFGKQKSSMTYDESEDEFNWHTI